MKISLLNLKRQYKYLKEDIEKNISEILEGGAYINGLQTKKFEKRMEEYLGVKHAIGIGNGTDALVIALEALGIGRGDEVITSPFTFFATAEAISVVGAVPVFVDVKLEAKKEYRVDLEELKDIKNMDAVIVAVGHKEYRDMDIKELHQYYNEVYSKPLLIDVKSIFDKEEAEKEYDYWRL